MAENFIERPASNEVSLTHDPAAVYDTLTNGDKEQILDMVKNYKIDSKCIYKKGDTLPHAILRNVNLKEVDVIEILTLFFKQDTDPNIKNEEEETVLHLAVVKRKTQAIDFLIESNANIDVVNKQGDTLAHLFIMDEYKKLKQITEDPYIKLTMEHYEKIENDSVTFLEFLISKDFDFDRKNIQTLSALDLAIVYYLQHYLPTLFKHTEGRNLINKDNKTLLELFLEKSALIRQSQLANVNRYSDYNPRYATKSIKVLFDRGVAKAIYQEYGRLLISEVFEKKEESIVVKTLIDNYLNNCCNDNFASDIFHELISTCGFWSDSETDYFLTILRGLIVKGADVNTKNGLRKRPVYVAENFRVLEFLYENGVDFSLKTKRGQTLLHLFAEQTPKKESKRDIYSEAWCLTVFGNYNVNVTCKGGKTPLHTAASHGNVPIVRVLIDLDADINFKDENLRTPLHEAIMMNKSVELIELLVTSGADVNAVDSMGDTPLHFAIDNSNASIVRLLIEHGARVDCQNKYRMETPLHRAVVKSDMQEVVELLLAFGANVSATDYKGHTPLLNHFYFDDINLLIVQSLLNHGANVNCWHQSLLETPLHRAVMNNVASEIVELMVDFGADVNAKDCKGNTPLHYIFNNDKVTHDGKRLLKTMLMKKTYVNTRNVHGKSILFIALSLTLTDLIRMILQYSADLNEPFVQQLIPQILYDAANPRTRAIDQDFLLRHHSENSINTLFMKQKIRLQVAKLSYSSEYEAYSTRFFGYQELQEECSKEIEKLKNTFFTENVSLYSYLHMRPNCATVYVKNEKLQKLMECSDFCNQFPNYSTMILDNYQQAVVRKPLLEQAKEAWYKLTEGKLADSTDHVLVYLEKEDLIHIIRANMYNVM